MDLDTGQKNLPCVICLNPIEKICPSSHGNAPLSSTIPAVLKWLEIESPFSINNQHFCMECEKRNTEISCILLQFEELEKKLEILKCEVEGSFRDSERREATNLDAAQKVLRDKMAKKVQSRQGNGNQASLTKKTLRKSTGDDHSISQSQDEIKRLKLQYKLKPCCVNLSRFPTQLMRKLPVKFRQRNEDVLELFVTCPFSECENVRFSNDCTLHRHLERVHLSASTESDDEEDYSDVYMDYCETVLECSDLRCIFADCGFGVTFATVKDRDAHIAMDHGISVKKVDTNKKVKQAHGNGKFNNRQLRKAAAGRGKLNAKVSRKGTVSGETNVPTSHIPNKDGTIAEKCGNEYIDKESSFASLKCIFADCTSSITFADEDERNAHVKSSHDAVVDLDEFLHNQRKKKVREKKTAKLTWKFDSSVIQCTFSGCKVRRKFSSQEEYDLHVRKRHEGITHPLTCTECGRNFRYNKELQFHVKTIHEGEYPFVCEYCGKGFVSQSVLIRHMPKHTNERNYSCSKCDRAFKCEAGLRYHNRSAHTTERQYSCEICGKSFITLPHVKKHIRAVHHRDERPYICHICGKGFPVRNYLTMHLYTHDKNRPNKKKAKMPNGSADVQTPDLIPNHTYENNLASYPANNYSEYLLPAPVPVPLRSLTEQPVPLSVPLLYPHLFPQHQ